MLALAVFMIWCYLVRRNMLQHLWQAASHSLISSSGMFNPHYILPWPLWVGVTINLLVPKKVWVGCLGTLCEPYLQRKPNAHPHAWNSSSFPVWRGRCCSYWIRKWKDHSGRNQRDSQGVCPQSSTLTWDCLFGSLKWKKKHSPCVNHCAWAFCLPQSQLIPMKTFALRTVTWKSIKSTQPVSLVCGQHKQQTKHR